MILAALLLDHPLRRSAKRRIVAIHERDEQVREEAHLSSFLPPSVVCRTGV